MLAAAVADGAPIPKLKLPSMDGHVDDDGSVFQLSGEILAFTF